jgi:hypothetical protein
MGQKERLSKEAESDLHSWLNGREVDGAGRGGAAMMDLEI